MSIFNLCWLSRQKCPHVPEAFCLCFATIWPDEDAVSSLRVWKSAPFLRFTVKKKKRKPSSLTCLCLLDMFHLSQELLGKWYGGFKHRPWRVSRAMHGRAASGFVLDAPRVISHSCLCLLSLLARLFKLGRFYWSKVIIWALITSSISFTFTSS